MKCINKKRKKVLFLKLAAVIIVLFVILGIVLLSKDKNFEDEHPYNKSIQAFGTSAREDALVAPRAFPQSLRWRRFYPAGRYSEHFRRNGRIFLTWRGHNSLFQSFI